MENWKEIENKVFKYICDVPIPTLAIPQIMELFKQVEREAYEQGKKDGTKKGIEDFYHEVDCCTLISELYGWRGILNYAKERALKINQLFKEV